MAPHKQLPNSLRNIRAKLQILSRPAVWGTAGFLLLVGLLMSEYLANPEQFAELISPTQTQEGKSDTVPGLSPEEKAIMADIDRSSALLKELKGGDAGKQPSEGNSKSLIEQKLGLGPQAGKDTKSVDVEKDPNAIGPETANLLAGAPLPTAPIKGNTPPVRYDTGIPGGMPSAMPSAGQIYDTTLGNSLLNATGGSGNLPPASPLQSALDRYKLGQNSSLPSANSDVASETEAAFNAGFTGVAQSFPNKPGVTPSGGSLDEFNPPYRGPRPGRDPGRLSSTGTNGINSSLTPTLPGQIAPSTNYGLPNNALTPGTGTNYGLPNNTLTPGTGTNTTPDNAYQYLTGSPSSPTSPNAPLATPSAPTVTPSNFGQSPLPTSPVAPLPTSNSPLQPQSRPAVPTNASQPAFPGFNGVGEQAGGGINNYGQPAYPGFNAPGLQPQGLPAIPNNYRQSPLPSLNTPSTDINSAYPSNYGTPGLPVPNSQPNYAPSGSIGNGQINTFSNPTR